jgi:hypothetical protein
MSSGRIPKENLKCQPEGNVSFIKTSEMAEGFYVLMSVTGLIRLNTYSFIEIVCCAADIYLVKFCKLLLLMTNV